jgi:hypothetical protein
MDIHIAALRFFAGYDEWQGVRRTAILAGTGIYWVVIRLACLQSVCATPSMEE